jgi:hypothetical protein
VQLLLKFAQQYGHFPAVLEAPPEYAYTLSHSDLGREEVAQIEHVTDVASGDTVEVSTTIGLGKPAFVHKAESHAQRDSMIHRLELGLDLRVEPRPAGSPLIARDEWGRCAWSQESRSWIQEQKGELLDPKMEEDLP